MGVHPSEPNYIWAEAGHDFGVANDDTPYHADCTPDAVQTTDLHLTAFLTKAQRSWRSYQEDTDVDLATDVPCRRRRGPFRYSTSVARSLPIRSFKLFDAIQLRGGSRVSAADPDSSRGRRFESFGACRSSDSFRC